MVEEVRQTVKQVQLIRPGDRAQGQVMLMQNHGTLRLQAPCPLRDQLSWLPREDTSAGCMAYKAQPSFLIAPDSSGHQFYSARLFTRNPLTNQLDRLVILQTGVRDGATTSTMTQM